MAGEEVEGRGGGDGEVELNDLVTYHCGRWSGGGELCKKRAVLAATHCMHCHGRAHLC